MTANNVTLPIKMYYNHTTTQVNCSIKNIVYELSRPNNSPWKCIAICMMFNKPKTQHTSNLWLSDTVGLLRQLTTGLPVLAARRIKTKK